MKRAWNNYEVTPAAGQFPGVVITDERHSLVVELVFKLDGEIVAGFVPDDEQLWIGQNEQCLSRLGLDWGESNWTMLAEIENRQPTCWAKKSMELTAQLGDNYAGWFWASGVDGVLVITPNNQVGPSLVVQLVRGHWAPLLRPAFVPSSYFVSPQRQRFGMRDHTGIIELASYRREQVKLRIQTLDSGPTAALMPHWLPELIVPSDTELEFRDPDQAIQPYQPVTVEVHDEGSTVNGPDGHQEVLAYDARGVHEIQLTWVPQLHSLLSSLAAAVLVESPQTMTSAAGLIVAEALNRRIVDDRDVAVDWLERVDWLAYDDLLGIAVTAQLARYNSDAGVWASAWRQLQHQPLTAGFGLIVIYVWLIGLGLGIAPGMDEVRDLLNRPSVDPQIRLELALLTTAKESDHGDQVRTVMKVLGGDMPGHSIGVDPGHAGRLASLLRLCPERWSFQPDAAVVAEKTRGLLLADCVLEEYLNLPAFLDNEDTKVELDGLAWLLVGDFSAS